MKRLIYIMIIWGWSCEYSSKSLIPYSTNFESIELIDTFNNKLKLDIANSITEAEFHPAYIGIRKDSIKLTYWSGDVTHRSNDWRKFKEPDSIDLKIYVDTTRIIGAVNDVPLPPPPPPLIFKEGEKEKYDFWEKQTFRGDIKSYPVFITNISNDTLKVGTGENIKLITEAKDSLGNWKPIQKPSNLLCGTGLTLYYLPSTEIILTSCKLFDGDFETTMRLIFESDADIIIKSNEFKGKMNYSQFDEPKNYYH